MSWYAARSARTVRQVVSDVFVVFWTIGWWWVSRIVHDTIDALADPGRRAAAASQQVADSFRSAGDAVGSVPGAGPSLRAPFDRAADSMASVVTSAQDQVLVVERLADVIGVVTVAIPVLVVVVSWLPVRLRFLATARASARFVDARADLDLFALRAMATQPLPALARISDDPVGAWRSGDRTVIDALAAAELRRCGIRIPPGLLERSGDGQPRSPA